MCRVAHFEPGLVRQLLESRLVVATMVTDGLVVCRPQTRVSGDGGDDVTIRPHDPRLLPQREVVVGEVFQDVERTDEFKCSVVERERIGDREDVLHAGSSIQLLQRYESTFTTIRSLRASSASITPRPHPTSAINAAAPVSAATRCRIHRARSTSHHPVSSTGMVAGPSRRGWVVASGEDMLGLAQRG